MKTVENRLKDQDQVKKDQLNKERDDRCEPLALKMIQMFGAHDNHNLLSQDKTETFNCYNELAQKFLSMMVESELPIGEYGYIQQLVNKGLDEVNSIVIGSLNKHTRDLQEKTFGCQISEIKTNVLHELLDGDTIE